MLREFHIELFSYSTEPLDPLGAARSVALKAGLMSAGIDWEETTNGYDRETPDGDFYSRCFAHIRVQDANALCARAILADLH